MAQTADGRIEKPRRIAGVSSYGQGTVISPRAVPAEHSRVAGFHCDALPPRVEEPRDSGGRKAGRREAAAMKSAISNNRGRGASSSRRGC